MRWRPSRKLTTYSYVHSDERNSLFDLRPLSTAERAPDKGTFIETQGPSYAFRESVPTARCTLTAKQVRTHVLVRLEFKSLRATEHNCESSDCHTLVAILHSIPQTTALPPCSAPVFLWLYAAFISFPGPHRHEPLANAWSRGCPGHGGWCCPCHCDRSRQ